MNCYAAFAKDNAIRMSGSSGGIFPLISQRFINDNGIVYAAVYDDSFNVECVRIDTYSDLTKSFTSKYMQSRLNDTFKNIKKDLNQGYKVLFCGTPCQVTGVRRFLENCKCNTENLLLMDFICHGVPSEDVFHKYMEQYDKKCVSLNMRNKELGWNGGNFSWKMTFEDGSEALKNQQSVPFMQSFLSNLCLRPSCYECKARNQNGADITVGDFWGVGNVLKDIDLKNGVSCIIQRSEKGKKYIDDIADFIELYSVSYSDILKANICLEESVKRPYFRSKFFRKYKTVASFDGLVSQLSPHRFVNRVLNKAYSYVPKMRHPVGELKEKGERLIYNKKEQCCGCTACAAVCPKDAIVLKKDSEGFFYPVIKTEKCINCNLCDKVCFTKNS